MSCLFPLPKQDPIYVGGKHRRVHGDAYFELVDEFLTAVKRRYGTSGGGWGWVELLPPCPVLCTTSLALCACVGRCPMRSSLLPRTLGSHPALLPPPLCPVAYQPPARAANPCTSPASPACLLASLPSPSCPPCAPVLIDLAGMDYETQMKLINGYRGTFPMYSDSGAPPAAAAAAALLPPPLLLRAARVFRRAVAARSPAGMHSTAATAKFPN